MHSESQAERIPIHNDDRTNILTIPLVQDRYKYSTQSTQTALLLDTINGYLENTINGYGNRHTCESVLACMHTDATTHTCTHA